MSNRRHLASLALVALATLFFSAFAATGQHRADAAVTTFVVALTTADEVPAVPASYPGSAFARFTFDSTTNILTYDVTVSGLTANLITAAHIHRGAPGVAGPVIYFLSPTGFTQASGKITLTDADVADLKAGNLYANVHSTEYPAGFARGQMYLDPAQAVRKTFDTAIAAWNRKDTASFIRYFTDNGLATEFQTTRQNAIKDLADFIGDPPITFRSFTNAQQSDRSITGDFEYTIGASITRERDTLILDGFWKVDATAPETVPIPANVTAVDLKLQEFSFTYDKTQVASGNVAFRINNAGTQQHEAVLVKLDPSVDLQKALQSQGPPPGVDQIAQAGPFDPGTQSSMVFTGPLSAGRYALLCFVPDTDGTPHAFKGMVSEFTVGNATGGSGTAIRPPSTGDAGLAAPAANAHYLLLALAMVSLTAAGGLFASKRA